MSRFYVPPGNVQGDKIFIDGEEAHHILGVMRMKEGDAVVVFDGTGNQYTGFITQADKKLRSLIVEVVKIEKPLPGKKAEFVLAQAIPKKDKMDYILEKATELGVSAIIPVVTDRTIVRPDADSSGKKLSRWDKICTSAAKQCGRVSTPEIFDIISYKNLINKLDEFDLCLFASLQGETVSLKNALNGFKNGKILIIIGPEGGFTPEEVKLVVKENCKFISLGNNVLKSDTAGLFVLSVLNYVFS